MASFQTRRYLLMTIDPVHVGTGGYRLGRVDNSIVREPGTGVPKIPGTSLHGAARSYSARLFKNINAAGKDHGKVKYPGMDPVCYTFGYVKEGEAGLEKKTEAWSGVANVFDASIVLFPVHSMAGPVWVSTLERLTDGGFTIEKIPDDWSEEKAVFTWQRKDPLNLGWLVLGSAGLAKITLNSKWEGKRWDAVKERIVLVKEQLFSHIVNSNLEVRTSVSIDPLRGAAEDGALFTYEAIPRSAFLVMDAILDDYRESFPQKTRLQNWLEGLPEDMKGKLEKQGWNDDTVAHALSKEEKADVNWNDPGDVLTAGLKMIEWLGVGGMGTRGFGRIGIVNEPLTKTYPEEDWK